MRHRHKLTKLGRNYNQRQALFRQLVNALIMHEKIKTTIAKAKVLGGLMDKLFTQAKKGTLAARRQLLAFLGYKPAVHKLMDELAPRTQARKSGFTKIIRVGTRHGDNAMLAQIEFIDKPVVTPKKEEKK